MLGKLFSLHGTLAVFPSHLGGMVAWFAEIHDTDGWEIKVKYKNFWGCMKTIQMGVGLIFHDFLQIVWRILLDSPPSKNGREKSTDVGKHLLWP